VPDYGQIIAVGTPEMVATEAGSYTGRFLEDLVELGADLAHRAGRRVLADDLDRHE